MEVKGIGTFEVRTEITYRAASQIEESAMKMRALADEGRYAAAYLEYSSSSFAQVSRHTAAITGQTEELAARLMEYGRFLVQISSLYSDCEYKVCSTRQAGEAAAAYSTGSMNNTFEWPHKAGRVEKIYACASPNLKELVTRARTICDIRF